MGEKIIEIRSCPSDVTANNPTVVVSWDGEEDSCTEVCHTLPLVLGFFAGFVAPVIILVLAKHMGTEYLSVDSLFTILHYHPIILLGFFSVLVLCLVVIFFIHCRCLVEMARVARQQRKDSIDGKNGLVKNVLDYLSAGMKGNMKKGDQMNLMMCMKTTSKVSDCNQGTSGNVNEIALEIQQESSSNGTLSSDNN